MSILKSKVFDRFARKHDLTDADIRDAANDVMTGQADADLGGGVFKQRVARDGGGKSGGFRTVILYKHEGHAFFVYGFAKNERANIGPDELQAFKKLARLYAAWPAAKVNAAVATGELIEVESDEDDDEASNP